MHLSVQHLVLAEHHVFSLNWIFALYTDSILCCIGLDGASSVFFINIFKFLMIIWHGIAKVLKTCAPSPTARYTLWVELHQQWTPSQLKCSEARHWTLNCPREAALQAILRFLNHYAVAGRQLLLRILGKKNSLNLKLEFFKLSWDSLSAVILCHSNTLLWPPMNSDCYTEK